jgi:hypothetical protein
MNNQEIMKLMQINENQLIADAPYLNGIKHDGVERYNKELIRIQNLCIHSGLDDKSVVYEDSKKCHICGKTL